MDSMAVPRKRIGRACDQCKRRKTKCSGQQDWDGCAALGLHCSFGSPHGKARGPAYIAQLEQTVRRLQSQIEANPSENSGIDGPYSMERRVGETVCLVTIDYPAGEAPASRRYGCCSGVEILRRLRMHLDRAVGFPSSKDAVEGLTDSLDRPLLELCVSPTSAFHVCSPLKSDLLLHVDVAFAETFWLRPLVDRDAVEAAIHRVYNTSAVPAASYYARDEMALIYTIAAVGAYLNTEGTPTTDNGEDEHNWQGITYFRTARSLVDPSNCERSMVALRTVICMTIYLVVTSAITRAHMFIDIAAAAAVRIGLHGPPSSPNHAQYDEIQRKRTLRSIKAIKVYIATLLGLPCSLEDLEPGQWASEEQQWASIASSTKPNEVDAAMHVCTETFVILRNASQELYFSGSRPVPSGYYSLLCSTLERYNAQLENWILSTSKIKSSRRLQLLVRQTGAYVQMVLNSPFLHYLTVPASLRHNDGSDAALKCVAAAIHTIESIRALRDERLLNWAHSFTSCSLAFAAITLLTIETSGVEVPDMGPVKIASSLAENLFKGMAMQHLPALGCFRSLQPLYGVKHWRQHALTVPELISSRTTTSSWTSPSTDDTYPRTSLQPMTSWPDFVDQGTNFKEVFGSF